MSTIRVHEDQENQRRVLGGKENVVVPLGQQQTLHQQQNKRAVLGVISQNYSRQAKSVSIAIILSLFYSGGRSACLCTLGKFEIVESEWREARERAKETELLLHRGRERRLGWASNLNWSVASCTCFTRIKAFFHIFVTHVYVGDGKEIFFPLFLKFARFHYAQWRDIPLNACVGGHFETWRIHA